MLTPDNRRQLCFNDFSQANRSLLSISLISIPLMAIAIILAELQPLRAEEINTITPLLSQATISTPDPQTKEDLEDLFIVNDADNIPKQIVVKSFDIIGSSVFSPQELNQAVKPYLNRPLTYFASIL